MTDQLVYKREVNKSVLHDGFGIDRDYLPVFLSRIGYLNRGEARSVDARADLIFHVSHIPKAGIGCLRKSNMVWYGNS